VADFRFTLPKRFTFGLHYAQDTWSGATPVTTMPRAAVSHQVLSGASAPTGYFTNAQHVPITVNWETYDGTHVDSTVTPENVHLMASASPETRREVDLQLGQRRDETAIAGTIGVSDERDYRSASLAMNGRFDFRQKLTSLNWAWRYSRSRVAADISANSASDWGAYTDLIHAEDGASILRANRQDGSLDLGLSQILSPRARIDLRLGYTRSSGFLETPYKAVMLAFDDPNQDTGGLSDVREVVLRGALEQRPDVRNQGTVGAQYVRFVRSAGAALHLNYLYFRDDWGLRAHTVEFSWDQPFGRGWMLTPMVRDYSQTAADFYRPFFFFEQAYPVRPGTVNDLDRSRLPIHLFSSDQRLSAFGALSGGLVVTKRFEDRIGLELGYETYRHAGSLKWGGGDGKFADFDSSTAYFLLTGNLAASTGAHRQVSDPMGDVMDEVDGHDTHGGHVPAPAGVMNAHALGRAGELMIGYRLMNDFQDGAMMRGGGETDSPGLIARGCGSGPCYLEPTRMTMLMHMLEIMYAPTRRLTLMLMPQFTSMEMDLEAIEGAPPIPPNGGHQHVGTVHHHATGGLGDTILSGLVQLAGSHRATLVGALGLSIPTGDSQGRVSGSNAYTHYGMQLGSGTWDASASLAWSGQAGRWGWGGQGGAIRRLQEENNTGYALGDQWQATAWGRRSILPWLGVSVRGLYTAQGAIRGQFVPHWESVQSGQTLVGTELVPVYTEVLQPNPVLGPMDTPANYGGRFWDAGLGVDATIRAGTLAGNRFSLEWLQPVRDDFNGFQLERSGRLVFAWSIVFGR
jgi:hypothetical protein